MTVLQVISSGGFYGAESMVLNLMQALDRIGCRPVLASFVNDHRPSEQLAGIARERGIPVELIRCRGRADASAVRQLRKCARQVQAHVIHSHGYKANLYSYIATRGSKLPLVATCHNWTDMNAAVTWYGRLDRLILRRFQKVAAVSPQVASILAKRVRPEKLKHIGNGVPIEAFDSTGVRHEGVNDPTACRIGLVGRLTPAKGFMDVLRGAPKILAKFPATKFVIFGDGPQAGELKAMVRNEGLSESVSFYGHCSEPDKIFDAMDIFVLPSYLEGTPMTILEALAARKPVVASSVGAIPELLNYGRNGLLVSPGDGAALVGAICCLLGNPDLRRRFAEKGRDLVVRKYSAALMAEKYVQLYSEAAQILAPDARSTPAAWSGVSNH